MRTDVTCVSEGHNKAIIAGQVEGETFYKNAVASHYFWKYKSYGIQENVFQHLVREGIKTIVVTVLEASDKSPKRGIYTSDVKDWLGPKIKVEPYGYGLQRFFSVKRMRYSK